MVGSYLILYRVAEHRAVVEAGEVVEHAEVGGVEGIVEVVRIFHASEDYPDLI
jgi:plasmid stabilization system protein ParE